MADTEEIETDPSDEQDAETAAPDVAVSEEVAVAKEKPTEKVRSLKYEEQEKYLGDLEPGDEGYLPLDENGYVAGPATKEKPARGQKWCRVVSPAASRPPLLQTPSGSPLANFMNPDAESIA